MDFLVCKFGGSSVATSEKMKKIVSILKKNKNRRCVVLSAPGKAPGFNVKVTDLLIESAQKALNDQDYSATIQEIRSRFMAIYEPLGVPDDVQEQIYSEIDKRLQSPKDHEAKFRDLVVSAGEDINSKLFAQYLNTLGMNAQYVSPKDASLIVTDQFGDAQPLDEVAMRLASLKRICAEKIVIFPGFFGYTEKGEVATFSRGGSDLTGAILAEAIDAAEYENWTDVDGIFSAHPGIVDNPSQISALTYKEMRELSYIGFNVLHEEAVKPIMKKKIPIRLRNTNNIENKGTLIVSERLPNERDIIGVASGGGYCSFTLQKFLMNREKGFGRKTLSIIEDMDLSYEHCPSGVDNISVILDQTQLKAETVNNIIRAFDEQLTPEEIKTEFGIALVSLVGEGLIHKIGVLGQAATALSESGVNIKMVNQGSSEISIIFGIDASDEKKAVNALYNAFFIE
ncbi:aspartate kinase [Chitinispirillales bacterium ANBcel5]|uniref:aspartate kinase n=1 Tax=Cellulosispirillum alkaliphilum TaxID=3039283 RepID=UPI002A53C348|nr:aspartate kinase [Chitinispirillales bacterium ANBcel5]